MAIVSGREGPEVSVSCLVRSSAWRGRSGPAVLPTGVDLFVSWVEKAMPDNQMNVRVMFPCC